MAAKKKKTTTKKKTRKTAAKAAKKSDGSAALELARAFLRRKPTASFGDVKAAAEKKKIMIYPITYGRAKALEGLVKVAAYGASKKSSKKSGAKRGPGRPKGSKNKRGPGRPKGSKNKRGPGRPRTSSMTGLDSIENLVSTIKTLQRERDDAVNAVDKIRFLLASL
jgi:hypothetical protein